jgi:uncharacterized protein YuzE
MAPLPALLRNAMSLVSTFFVEMSKKRQRCAFRFWQSSQTVTVIVSNNYLRISGKMGFTIEDKY